MLLGSAPKVIAGENVNPVDKALITTTLAPTVVIEGTSALTSNGPEAYKSAKSDALAFIGSNGEIRGARFEQASRHYHATGRPPLMSDQQLARAIAASD